MSVYIERAEGLKPIIIDHTSNGVSIQHATALDPIELRRLWNILAGSLAAMDTKDVVIGLPRRV